MDTTITLFAWYSLVFTILLSATAINNEFHRPPESKHKAASVTTIAFFTTMALAALCTSGRALNWW